MIRMVSNRQYTLVVDAITFFFFIVNKAWF